MKSLGSFSDLDAEIKARYAGEPANVPAWLPLMYWRAMLNGSGTIGPLMNDRYPDIRPTGVRQYVSRLATEPQLVNLGLRSAKGDETRQ